VFLDVHGLVLCDATHDKDPWDDRFLNSST
jgi:hypothetical protein